MLCSLSVFADDVTPGITISKTDASKASVAISQLRSIKFEEGSMIVNMKDNSKQTFNIDDIASISFDDISTAINALTNGNIANATICITDLSGNIIYKGIASHAPAQEKLSAGIYVITVNGKSQKVMIR